MRAWLEACREALAPVRRRFDITDWVYWQCFAPEWVQPGYYSEQYEQQKLLREEGLVVWAAVVKANSLLFEPGHAISPLLCVFSPEPRFDDDLAGVTRIARACQRLREPPAPKHVPAEFVERLNDDFAANLRSNVPGVLTGGRQAFTASTVLHRKHLPNGFLSNRAFPLLVLPKKTRATMVLPSAYWPPELREAWEHGPDFFRSGAGA